MVSNPPEGEVAREVARLEGLEPPTRRVEAACSDPLSYKRVVAGVGDRTDCFSGYEPDEPPLLHPRTVAAPEVESD